MDLRQLKTFRIVAELGSLSKAADRLHIAQPALSRQVRLLEHDLRTPLFIRHGRGMVPTDAGQMLFERTTGLVRQLEQAREDVLNAARAPTGRVVVGMVPTICSILSVTIAQQVTEQYPGVMLRMVDAYASHLVDGLHRGEIDIGVIYGPSTGLHLNVETLRYDDLFAFGAPGCGLGAKRSVSLGWLGKRSLILPSAPHALRALVDEAYAAAGATLSIKVEADSFQALKNMVLGALGVTVLPYYAAAAEVASGRLECAPIRPKLRRELVLALPPRHRTSVAADLISDIVRSQARALAEP
jgi:DNA-binding transcriptional LysR family regulator